MLNLKYKIRNYGFWLSMIALAKVGVELNLYALPTNWETAAMQFLLALVGLGIISDNSKGKGYLDK